MNRSIRTAAIVSLLCFAGLYTAQAEDDKTGIVGPAMVPQIDTRKIEPTEQLRVETKGVSVDQIPVATERVRTAEEEAAIEREKKRKANSGSKKSQYESIPGK